MRHISILAIILSFVFSAHDASAVSSGAIARSIKQRNVDDQLKAGGLAVTDKTRNALMQLETAGIQVTAKHIDALKGVMAERAAGRVHYPPPLANSILDATTFPGACANLARLKKLKTFVGWIKRTSGRQLVFRAFEYSYQMAGGNSAHGINTNDGLRNFAITNNDSGAKEYTGKLGSSAVDPVFSATADTHYVDGYIDANGALVCLSGDIAF